MIDDEDYTVDLTSRGRRNGKTGDRVAPESEITERVLTWLNSRPETFARKRFSSVRGQTGHPDIEGCSRGRSIQIEMKRPGERPTRLQFARMRVWQEAGALVGWACSVADVEQLFARLDQPGWRNPLTSPGDGTLT